MDGREGRGDKTLWRSLDELSGAPAFRAHLEAEFPALAAAEMSVVDRRVLLKAAAATAALAGLAGCNSETDQKALPYVEAPDGLELGIAKWYATAVTMAGIAQPVLGKTREARPVKLEGNPDHAASLGATDAFTQAALMGLYDPDRSTAPRFMGRPSTWDAFETASSARMAELEKSGGNGFRLLTGAITSPTLLRQIADLQRRWPQTRWHAFEPADEGLRRNAAHLIFGRPLDTHLRLDRAYVVVSLDDDMLGPGPRQVLNGRRWTMRRQAFQAGDGDSRLLVAEPTPTLTGIAAAERLVAAPSRIVALLATIAKAFGVAGAAAGDLTGAERAWVDHAVAALDANQGRGLITVGAQHAPELQATCFLVNDALGNLGHTIEMSEPVATEPPDGARSFAVLVEDIRAGRVSTLFALDCNPAYAAPGALGFASLLERIELRLHAGCFVDETAALAHWHLPLAHELESWSDARAADGAISLMQPLVRPFYEVRSRHVLLETIAGRSGASDHDLVQATWRAAWGEGFEAKWRDALYRGVVEGGAPPPLTPAIVNRAIAPPAASAEGGLTLVIRPDPTIWDGRFAENPWLQELAKPVTKVAWDNVIGVAPDLAASLRLANGDEVELKAGGASLKGAVWIVPGQDPAVIVATLGYGRRLGGGTEPRGYDAYRLRRSDQLWHIAGAALLPTGEQRKIATTQSHHAMDGFDFVRTADGDALRGGKLAPIGQVQQPSFYPAMHWTSPSWGMSIDLDTCIGCNACVLACQAENNIPVVGKDRVAEGREMQWIRVDHYHQGDPAAPEMSFQPVPCMHCEQAPCEMGCPVNAAVHSADGLNLQVYNRCVGTRTCSSFCPYKVRRFNWFEYTENDPEPVRAMRNPDVTARARGVMEKCTYCVQRINVARIQAKKEGRAIREGEVVTACQQACPTSAISFGDVLDPESAVSRRKASPRDYSLLAEVNTRPRTTYLAKIKTDRPAPPEGKG